MSLNNEFMLMNKDVPVLKFVSGTEGISKVFNEVEWTNNSLKPLGYNDLQTWLEKRQASKHRESISKLLKEIGCFHLDGFLRVTHALSLNDTFWVKEVGSPLLWKDVSLYTNPFDEVISRIAFEGGLYGRKFHSTTPEFGVSGNYKKCWVREGNEIFLLKGGSEGVSNAGLEPFCEGLAAQVSKLICPKVVDYEITKFKEHDVSKCKLFTDEQFGYVPVTSLFEDDTPDNDIYLYFQERGYGDIFRRMVVLDALILNQDRHRGNYGFFFNNDTLEVATPAPIFDHNISLLAYASENHLKDVEAYFQTIGPKIGDDFNEIAHMLLTPAIKSDLKNLRGFEFDFSRCPNFSVLRKDTLNIQFNKQIDRILDNVHINLSAIPTSETPEISPDTPTFSFFDSPDYSYFKDKLSDQALTLLGSIITAYEENKIGLSVYCDESGTIDPDKSYSLTIYDENYHLTGNGTPEILVLKWYEGYESEDNLVSGLEVFVNRIQKLSIDSQIRSASGRAGEDSDDNVPPRDPSPER